MKKIWFRVGMECEITDEEMNLLLIYSGQIGGVRDVRKVYAVMKEIIKRATLSGETYILGKDCGGVDVYDNPKEEVGFLF